MQEISIILGSSSPRRQEILGYFRLPFTAIKPSFDEDSVIFQGQPEEYVCRLSQGKAESLAKLHPESIILTADTTVYHNGKIYNKPKDEEDAFQSFSELVGQWHTVYTGVTVCRGKEIYTQPEGTRVLFNQLTPDQCRHYLDRVEWRDKAAGYAIQMAGGLVVRRIDGCYYNVMGLPVNTVRTLLKHFGIDLWDYL